ncbi:MAG: EAL domain-containing protein [Clostridia bacterium]|nr:EAL domain-containing protein [Clostridia bacterium]
MFEEQLVDDFKRALKENQFEVYYQPKFNIQKSEPYLVSCEALIRWNHKTLGMVSPGVFIPLFENNGLIQELDNYVWERAAKQIVDWKERFHKTIPVSVNVSRIDIHDPQLIAKFKNIVGSNDLDNRDIILEITESAYVSDESLIVRTINELKQQGFIIEMDDFGTGYSSLNMISNLPIDVLKLDMVFIRNAFKENKNTKILELIINLAKKLSLKVVAEGVETKEQVDVLKELGCDIVQGYYFSKPVKASEFEKFIRQEI